MKRGSYIGGSTIIKPWLEEWKKHRLSDRACKGGEPLTPAMIEAARVRKAEARKIREAAADRSRRLAEAAAELLRKEGMSETEIRRRLKLSRKGKR